MKLTKSELREIIREEISKLNRTSTRLTSLVNEGWILSEAEGTIKNPETGRTIKISTALGYDKNHPAYKIAAKQSGAAQPSAGKPATSDTKIKGAFDVSGGVNVNAIRKFAKTMDRKQANSYLKGVIAAADSIDKSKNELNKVEKELGKFGSNWNTGNPKLSKEEKDIAILLKGSPLVGYKRLIDYSKQNPTSKLALKPKEIAQVQKQLSQADKHSAQMDTNLKKYGASNRNQLDKLRDEVANQFD
jgi:hypothetical protein